MSKIDDVIEKWENHRFKADKIKDEAVSMGATSTDRSAYEAYIALFREFILDLKTLKENYDKNGH